METLAALNFSTTTLHHKVQGVLATSTIYLRPGNEIGRCFVLLAGFLQGAEQTWTGFIEKVFGVEPGMDTIIVIGRRGESLAPSPLTGLLPLGWQIAEVRAVIWHLGQQGFIKPGATIIGHSLGALLARQMVNAFPQLIRNIIQIAPVPDYPRFLLFNWAFWWKAGGLLALPFALLGLWRGIRLPQALLRRMFGGPHLRKEDLEEYQKRCVADSAILFTQLLFFYRGFELIEAKKNGWHGRNSYLICPGDVFSPTQTINKLAEEHRAAGIQSTVTMLEPSTPHSWFALPHQWGDRMNRKHWLRAIKVI